jgi:hypothetical protein
MKDSISTPGMGAMGIVRALMGNIPGVTKGSGKKRKKKPSGRKNGRRKKG